MDAIDVRQRKMVCFDMDGTLLDGEVLDAVAERCGIGDEVRRITDLAMNGMIGFEDAVRMRLGLLKGLPVSRLIEIADSVPLMPGAVELIARLKEKGFVTGMITGGFSPVARRVSERLGLDFFVANDLGESGGLLNGDFGMVVSANKGDLLKKEAMRFRAQMVFAVGDGSNDLGMLMAADVGIAFCPKPALEERARVCIKEKDLMRVWDYIGEV